MSQKDFMRYGKGLLAGLWMFLSAGCLVGPNFHAPRVKVPDSWNGTTTAAANQMNVTTAEAAEVKEWWKSFNDPELDSLVSRAVDSNLDLKQATVRILQARAARGITAAGLWPNVGASGSYRRSRSGGGVDNLTGSPIGSGGGSGTSSGLASSGASSFNLFQAGLDAAWELDFFGGVRRGIEAAEADIQAAIEDRRFTLVTLTAEVALNYSDLRGFQQQIAIAEKNLDAQRHSAELTHQRFDVGFASKLDVANADAQVATTLSQIPVFEAAARQTMYNVSMLLGREPAALVGELSPAGKIPATPPVVPVGLPSDLLRRRPDIRRAEAQLHGATARIGVATADLFPKFSLTGSTALQGSSFGSLGQWSNRFWSFGPGVTWPVFAAGRIRSNIRLQNALQQEALLAYQESVLTALQDVETALVGYTKEQQHRAALADAVTANQTAVDLALRLYTAGETDFLNVLSAQRNLYTSEDALVQSNRTITTDLIALYKALGGGWNG